MVVTGPFGRVRVRLQLFGLVASHLKKSTNSNGSVGNSLDLDQCWGGSPAACRSAGCRSFWSILAGLTADNFHLSHKANTFDFGWFVRVWELSVRHWGFSPAFTSTRSRVRRGRPVPPVQTGLDLHSVRVIYTYAYASTRSLGLNRDPIDHT